MPREELGNEWDSSECLRQIEFRGVIRSARLVFERLVNEMMKLDSKNGSDWQGFSRILEIMSFLDGIEESCPEEIRDTAQKLCELPSNSGQTMSLEEVVFWAGVASGMEIARHADEETIDSETAGKMLIFSSIFSHSTKNAIVDLALGQMEPEANQVEDRRRPEYKLRRA